ncbi:flagellar biosynthetic protein FliR [Aurantivibrio infirmus]
MWFFTDEQILEFVGGYFFPLCRISAFFLAVPIIGTKLVPARVRFILAAATTILVVPLLPPLPSIPSFSVETLLVVVQQVLIGLAMGFVLQVVFHLFVVAGQLMANKMGLGFASMNDPSNGITVTVVSQFYLMLVTLLFLSLNGHLVMIDILVNSFQTLPISQSGIPIENYWRIAELGSWMFSNAIIISMPVLTSLLVVNLAFGVMSRSAPQINVFTVGFPITLIFGLVLIWLSLTSFFPSYEALVDEGFLFLNDTITIR